MSTLSVAEGDASRTRKSVLVSKEVMSEFVFLTSGKLLFA